MLLGQRLRGEGPGAGVQRLARTEEVGVATLDFGLVMRVSARGGSVAEMVAMNDRILTACREHDLTAWVVDHFQFDDIPLMEGLTLLTHSAGRTPGVRFGTLVLGQGFRNPALVAKIAATLQFLTGGRFILGIGAGWKEDEYHAYGYSYPPASVRIAQLNEAVQVIRTMWTHSPATWTGTHYAVNGAYCEPRPDPTPILMIGGAGEQRTLRVVAQHADWWNADYYSPDEYARKLDILHEHCRAIGRDEASIVPTYFATVRLSRHPDPAAATLPLSHRGELYLVQGNPDAVTRQLEAFAALGVRHVQLSFTDFPRTEGIDLFLSEVLPRFGRATQRA
jgi:alkanesulfonate monooxygenase SsuD/methylene tetrahydromethanopterin reductase-like flavin-dependent oxidoreductase (luciferase family)